MDSVVCEKFRQCKEAVQGDKRNHVVAAISGAMFSIGWWFIVDQALQYEVEDFEKYYYVTGVVGTVAMIIVNSVSVSRIRGEVQVEGGCLGPHGALLWLFVGFCTQFGALIAAIWIVCLPHKYIWPTVALLLHNIFIFASSMVLKLGRVDGDLWDIGGPSI